MARNGPGRPPRDDLLTPAEWAVVEFVRHGLTNRQIAARRRVSLDAVKFHVGNALGKLGLASRAELRRWDGVRRDSALKRREEIMDTQLGRIGQIARTVSDIAASEVWYREVLGLPHLFTFGEMAFFDCGGTRLYLQQGAAKPESILYFEVPDIHAAHRTLNDKGAEFVSAPHMIHRHADGSEEWMAFFNDPDGRPLALMARTAGG
uniref:LuxR C-terminal-related transcriptional regulator n=1 Tax=Altererythrobacter segetis TaxID=1104773 RepID=UPI00140A4DD4|nr:LuxR C-terminal-related transcriptional regulator [Altererythrobacter segetis]